MPLLTDKKGGTIKTKNIIIALFTLFAILTGVNRFKVIYAQVSSDSATVIIGEGTSDEYALPVLNMAKNDYSCRHWNCPTGGTCNAVDIFAERRRHIIAVTSGTATKITYPLGGYTVTLQGDDGISYYYAHLSEDGRVSGRVNKGDHIGYVDRTGSSCKPVGGVCTGAFHLHWSATTNGSHNRPNIWAQGLFEGWGMNKGCK